MDLSIVIVSYNARTELANCLDALLRHPPSVEHEIIVVDNASTDGSADEVTARSIRIIREPSNRGFAAANNIGIRAGRGTNILLLNSDTIVPPGAVDALVRRLRQSSEVAIVGPRLVDANGAAELSFGDMITPLSEYRQQRLRRRLAHGDPDAIHTVERMTRVEQRPAWVSGACLLVRRADAEAVGLLDERFFMYTEDVDFCAAVRARGRHVLFTPEVEVVHLRGRSASAAPEATRRAYERSHLAFYRKHHPLLVPFLLIFRLFGKRA